MIQHLLESEDRWAVLFQGTGLLASLERAALLVLDQSGACLCQAHRYLVPGPLGWPLGFSRCGAVSFKTDGCLKIARDSSGAMRGRATGHATHGALPRPRRGRPSLLDERLGKVKPPYSLAELGGSDCRKEGSQVQS